MNPRTILVGEENTEIVLLSLTLRGVIVRDLESGGKMPAQFDTYKLVHENDLVFCLFDIDETPRTVGLSPTNGMITGAYDVFSCREGICARYIYYFYLHLDATKSLRPYYTGLRKVVRPGTFAALKSPVPPLSEQVAIAAFLDRETAKIDTLIVEQERLMKLLKEKRQAVISHAVTKGLNPHAPMKDSGVEWLGEVPAHWLVATIRRAIARIEQGWSPECENQPAEGGQWGILKAGCVNRGIFNAQDNKALPSSLAPRAELEVRVGDVLMSRASGSPELVGSTAYVSQTPRQLMLSDKIFRLVCEEFVDPQFLVVLFNSRLMRSQIERAISGAEGLANNLPQSALLTFACAIPPVREQLAIVDRLKTTLSAIDSLVSAAGQAIDLLNERRSALISAAVTGQIDVRHLANADAA